jgi:hypothetical protein
LLRKFREPGEVPAEAGTPEELNIVSDVLETIQSVYTQGLRRVLRRWRRRKLILDKLRKKRKK